MEERKLRDYFRWEARGENGVLEVPVRIGLRLHARSVLQTKPGTKPPTKPGTKQGTKLSTYLGSFSAHEEDLAGRKI